MRSPVTGIEPEQHAADTGGDLPLDQDRHRRRLPGPDGPRGTSPAPRGQPPRRHPSPRHPGRTGTVRPSTRCPRPPPWRTSGPPGPGGRRRRRPMPCAGPPPALPGQAHPATPGRWDRTPRSSGRSRGAPVGPPPEPPPGSPPSPRSARRRSPAGRRGPGPGVRPMAVRRAARAGGAAGPATCGPTGTRQTAQRPRDPFAHFHSTPGPVGWTGPWAWAGRRGRWALTAPARAG